MAAHMRPTSTASSSKPAPNPFSALITQNTTIIPHFTLESGVTLQNVPVVYKTWGKLNAEHDNCLVICHALTGSADVEDWWGPLLGVDKAFDPTRFFIFCANVIGSPYGTVSSCTINPETGRPFGPEMPGSSPKDDVRLHYLILQQLSVRSIAAVIGGSMGGMTCLEYPLNTPPGFVRHIIPLATSARHSAWCISWGEAQRQSIYSDPDYMDGYYYTRSTVSNGKGEGDGKGEGEGKEQEEEEEVEFDDDLRKQPMRGLAAARMAALLTYRSRDSFESRFGRRSGVGKGKAVPKLGVRIMGGKETSDPAELSEGDLKRLKGGEEVRDRAWREHNDGHRGRGRGRVDGSRRGSGESTPGVEEAGKQLGGEARREEPKIFSAQSYLRYQGDKFTGRFDANCYIHITRKCDTHDLSLPSIYPHVGTSITPTLSSQLPPLPPTSTESDLTTSLHHALSLLPPALVIGIESDGLFTTSEQREIAAQIPEAELVVIPSVDGHDGFLLEFEAINGWVDGWLRRKVPEFFEERVVGLEEYRGDGEGWGVKKESVFGEAEADVTRW